MVVRGGFGVFYGAIVGDTALQQLTAPGFQGTNAYFEEVGGTLANPFGPDPFPLYGMPDLVQPTITNPFLTAGAEQVGVDIATRNTTGRLESRTLRARLILSFARLTRTNTT